MWLRSASGAEAALSINEASRPVHASFRFLFPVYGRRWPERPDEGQAEFCDVGAAPHLPAGIFSP
ncbi:hypothetical protein MES4922_300321 [Mesorhizobium ventifaucium]|uniref:Propionyl-coenzyme A carboxylase alpha polypeptide n=1 Tax=Mesorhizobium ventifaucium TaxID=666020 RepID=A0ABN8JYY3_9HYPH|nr:hypothetical protein MES4922_300321 [Mesorhizobium ventifaucium]